MRANARHRAHALVWVGAVKEVGAYDSGNQEISMTTIDGKEHTLPILDVAGQIYEEMEKTGALARELGMSFVLVIKDMKARTGMTQAMIGQLANLPCRHSEYITDVMTGKASGLVVQLVALIVLGFMLLVRSEGTDVLEITEMNGHSRGEFQMAKRQRKESEKNLLVKYDPHRDHLVQQYKTVLVRHGNGKATPDDADFTVVAEATYGTIHASPDIHHDKVLAALKALSKDDLFKQSKAVGRKWWGQSGGKGKRTATVLRADFKAALAKTTADAAAASEGEL